MGFLPPLGHGGPAPATPSVSPNTTPGRFRRLDTWFEGRDPGQAGGQGADREAAQGRARSVNVRELLRSDQPYQQPSSRWHLAGTQRLGEIPAERPARNLESTGCTLEVYGPVAE